ncbi:glycosyltransferase family 2 protein [Blastomonas aquatica]|uniref:Glycosyl transferase family 2 n=1 Tax=Blastomonas aquatica TaxID=1510276 RepID=A0ABQ1J071_9SPHN|nr:glycosyltransferase family 2 protein [Blastomonas aquatica]GGB55519.1 glycosyl transferase family 2 [Blastomonas aquatica]
MSADAARMAVAPRVAIAIVNWRNAADTIACLESLQHLADPDVAVTVCDNGSGDGSVEKLADWAQGALAQSGRTFRVLQESDLGDAAPRDYLTIIASQRNLGFAGGNNLCIRLALADQGIEAVWLLNNDTEVLADSLQALRARLAEDPQMGICGSTLVYHHDKTTVQAVAGRYDIARGSGGEIGQGLTLATLPPRDQVEAQMSYPPGASMLASRRFIDAVGLMEESYFLYFEEIDWTLRGKPRFTVGWAPGSVVFHKEGGSIGTNARGRPSDLSLYYNLVNRVRVARRFQPAAVPLIVARLAAIGARYLLKGDSRAARIVVHALSDFRSGRYRTGAWLSASRTARQIQKKN